jgi:hypothetical protein
MLKRWLTRKKPAPAGAVKPGPTPLEEACRRIAESVSDADKRTDRLLERLRERERKAAS